MVTNRDSVGEKHDELRGMGTGFLSFRRQQIDLVNCSLFLVKKGGLFGWFCPTRVVVLSDYGWSFWPTTLTGLGWFINLI